MSHAIACLCGLAERGEEGDGEMGGVEKNRNQRSGAENRDQKKEGKGQCDEKTKTKNSSLRTIPQQVQWKKQGLVFHSTQDIIRAAQNNQLPDKIIITCCRAGRQVREKNIMLADLTEMQKSTSKAKHLKPIEQNSFSLWKRLLIFVMIY